jgi:hypothetical protein
MKRKRQELRGERGRESFFFFASISLRIPLPILYLEAFSNIFNQGALFSEAEHEPVEDQLN